METIAGQISGSASQVTAPAMRKQFGSMTAEVKHELCRVVERSVAVRKAEVAAFLRFAGGLRVVDGRVVVDAEADHLRIAQRVQRDLQDLYGCNAQIQHATHNGARVLGPMHVHVVKGAEELARRIGLIDHWGRPICGVPSSLLRSRGDEAEGLWRGAFLAGGTLNGSGASAGLDISCPGSEVGSTLVDAADHLGVAAKARVVRGGHHVRVRDGQQVRALLCRIGAPHAVGLWAEQQSRHESSPLARSNFESANARRCSDAAAVTVVRVREALEVLGDSTPANLVQAGQLRIQYPAASLAELGQLATPQLSKDAVAGRIRRLLAIADTMDGEESIDG